MSMLQELVDDNCELEMTPMIDVTFLLLIFFLCTLKFKTLEGKLAAYLPKDVGVNSSDSEPRDKVEMTIWLVNEGEKRDPNDASKPWKGGEARFQYVNRVVEYDINGFRTRDLDVLYEQIKRRLEAAPSSEEKPDATIDPRTGTVYGDVVLVLDKAIEAEFESVTFVGSFED